MGTGSTKQGDKAAIQERHSTWFSIQAFGVKEGFCFLLLKQEKYSRCGLTRPDDCILHLDICLLL